MCTTGLQKFSKSVLLCLSVIAVGLTHSHAEVITPFRVTEIIQEGEDIRLSWSAEGGTTNIVQASSGAMDGSFTNIFFDISGYVLVPGIGSTNATFIDTGGATNYPSRFYQVLLCDAFLGNCGVKLESLQACVQNPDCASGNCSSGMCSEKFGNNYVCLDHDTCESGICSFGFCAQCLTDADCTVNQFCNLFGDCIDKFGNNHVCRADKECVSDICSFGFCAGCLADIHCELDEFCDVFGDCRTRCNVDADCRGDEFCDQLGACQVKLGNNKPCLKNSACQSDICSTGLCTECIVGLCVECAEDGHCPTGEYCDLGGDCQLKLENNAVCFKNSACQSGICLLGLCAAECASDGQCAASEFCDLLGDCQPKLGKNAICVKDSTCQSGICSVGFCAECTSDSHCSSSKYCDLAGDCQTRKGKCVLCCTRDRMCMSGDCTIIGGCTAP